MLYVVFRPKNALQHSTFPHCAPLGPKYSFAPLNQEICHWSRLNNS